MKEERERGKREVREGESAAGDEPPSSALTLSRKPSIHAPSVGAPSLFPLEELNNSHGGKVGEIALRRKTTKSSKDIVDCPVDIERREKVKEAMLHAWGSYEKYAWGQDELQPQSKSGVNSFGGLGQL
ncbi:hypothetical protein HN51_003569 [Arachis hypogaea]